MDNEHTEEGFEVIHAYTRAQALDDGVLVDMSYLAKEAGFVWPVAVTVGVWAVLEVSQDLRREGQSHIGRAWDMLMVLRLMLRASKDGREVRFAPLFITEPGGAPKAVELKAASGPGDEGEPVITIMLPNED